MGLVHRHTSTADLTHWKGRIPVNYVYTAGRAGEQFLREIKAGRLLAAQCEPCDTVYLPPRTYCEKCFNRIEDNTIRLSPKGKVHTFTVCHQKMDGTPTNKPLVIAMIQIEGTDGGLVHYLDGVTPEDVAIGMPVEAVFLPKKQRKGSILDIKYFRPRK